jgi:hypothetical protein
MPTLKHGPCGHEFEAAQELADRVRQDINGGTGGFAPPIRCPGCGVQDRYSAFSEVIPDA